MVDIAELYESLKNEVVRVKFTKVNGDERVMLCTLREDHLPLFDRPLSVPSEDGDDESSTIAVWDLEANGWRSFRTNSVISFERAF